MRLCGGCHTNKSEDAFYSERESQCKECRKAAARKCYKTNKAYRDRCRRNSDKWNFEHKEQKGKIRRKAQLKRRYDLTVEQHQAMYAMQNGRCAICKEPVPYEKTHTDHNHKTGQVRSLLCRSCNYLVGMVEKYKHLLPIVHKYIS